MKCLWTCIDIRGCWMGMWLFWSTCGCHPAIIPKCCHSSFTLNITTTCIITFPETLFEIWNRAALVRSERWTDLFIFNTLFFVHQVWASSRADQPVFISRCINYALGINSENEKECVGIQSGANQSHHTTSF